MKVWNHNELPYPFVPAEVLDSHDSVRAVLPNRYCDPKVAAQLYAETFDEFRLCDELGINLITTEHHAGINNLSSANPLITAVAAAITKKIRVLSMGTLVTVRPDPVRVAEEYATLDLIAKGRLDIGFVKSGGSEMTSGDANPVGIREREWEAVDLIEKALTSRDGPFSWEGRYYSHPHVNIWPRPLQEPRPDFWLATSDFDTVAELGRRGMVNALLFGGYRRTREAFDTYRRAAAAAGRPPPGEDRFAYLAFCYVADSDAEAEMVGQKIAWFLTVGNKTAPQFGKFQPGVAPADLAAKTLRGPSWMPKDLRPEVLIGNGQMFCGNPDSVAKQIRTLREKVGGLGHILMMTKQGLVTHAEAERSFTLMAREVLPQLQDLPPVELPAMAPAAAAS